MRVAEPQTAQVAAPHLRDKGHATALGDVPKEVADVAQRGWQLSAEASERDEAERYEREFATWADALDRTQQELAQAELSEAPLEAKLGANFQEFS